MQDDPVQDDRTGRPPVVDVRAALVRAGHDELVERGNAADVGLRAVTRRAHVSHAAPKHHFGDRRGLLTALAVDGYDLLHDRLREAAAGRAPSAARVADLGRAYVDLGLQRPALFDLMFRSDQLDPGNAALLLAQERAFAVLEGASPPSSQERDGADRFGAGSPAMVAWAFAHGLVALARDGTLERAAQHFGAGLGEAALLRGMTDTFAAMSRAATQDGG